MRNKKFSVTSSAPMPWRSLTAATWSSEKLPVDSVECTWRIAASRTRRASGSVDSATLEGAGVEREQPARRFVAREELGAAARGLAQLRARPGITPELDDRARERGRVLGRHEPS